MPEQYVPYNPYEVAVNGQCPEEPKKPSQSLKIPALPACPLTKGGNPPPVGSPEWCKCLDSLVKWVSNFGDVAFSWLFGTDGKDESTGFWGSTLLQLIPGVRDVNAVMTLAGGLSDKLDEKVVAIFASIKDATKTAGVCNPTAILGVELLRALLSALHNVRLGTDAGVWATVDLGFTVSLLDRILHYVAGYVCPVQIPEWGEIVGVYRRNTAPEGVIRCWARMRDHDIDVCQPVLDSVRRQPELIESFTLRNREVWDDAQYESNLRGLGFTKPDELNYIKDLRFQVPGPSDLVRFAVRHVFEPELIKRQGYDLEFDQLAGGLDPFHHAVGLDYKIFTGPLRTLVETVTGKNADQLASAYAVQGLPEPTWARAYWWSHYVTISPTQAYEAFFRLDPARDTTGEPDWMKPLKFDLDDLRLQLRVNDYSPPMRDILAAIAYRPPNLRFMRVQIKTKSITHKQAVQDMRAMGFRPDKAEQTVTALEREIQTQENEQLLKIVLKETEEAWELGLISDQEFTLNLMNAGVSDKEADARIAAATGARDVRIAKALTERLHKAFLSGRFTAGQVDAFLKQIGIVDRRRREYARVWDAEKQTGEKELTAAEAKKLATDGFLTLPQLAVRLRNLNYSPDAITGLLADVTYQLELRAIRQAQQAIRSADKEQRARVAALKALGQAKKEQQAQLAKHGSPAKLKTWYCDGLISAADVTLRLQALNWPQVDITRLLSECDAKRAKAGLPSYTEETGQGAPGG